MKTTIQILGVIALASALAHGEREREGKPGDKKGRPNPAKMIEHLDTDGNGSVSLAEFQASKRGQKNPEKAAEIFGHIDADSSGEITTDEFAKHLAHRHGQRGPDGRPGKGGRPNPAKMVERLDTDNSGAVSRDEFLAGKRAEQNPERAGKLFDRIDADSNGEITVDEVAKHMAKHKGKRPRDGRPDGGAGEGSID